MDSAQKKFLGVWLVSQPMMAPQLIPHDEAAVTLFVDVDADYAALFRSDQQCCVNSIRSGQTIRVGPLEIRSEESDIVIASGEAILRRYPPGFRGAHYDWINISHP